MVRQTSVVERNNEKSRLISLSEILFRSLELCLKWGIALWLLTLLDHVLFFTTNNNNNKPYLHDYNKVLQYCKSYLKLIIDSL